MRPALLEEKWQLSLIGISFFLRSLRHWLPRGATGCPRRDSRQIPIEIVVKADECHLIFVRKPGPALIVGLLKSQCRRGQAWSYPGDNFGQEFVYPKTRATQLAQ